MRHEVAVPEGSAGGTAQAHVLWLVPVGLHESGERAHNDGAREPDDEGPLVPGTREGARGPVHRDCTRGDRERARREPPVLGEQRRYDAEDEERDEKGVDARECRAWPPREDDEPCDGRGCMQRELLRHEEAIELERLVRERHEHDGKGTENDRNERDEIGQARPTSGHDVYPVLTHRESRLPYEEPFGVPRSTPRGALW